MGGKSMSSSSSSMAFHASSRYKPARYVYHLYQVYEWCLCWAVSMLGSVCVGQYLC